GLPNQFPDTAYRSPLRYGKNPSHWDGFLPPCKSHIEINPRLGGGSALGFAASENWITAMIEMFVYKQNITAKPIKYGLKMARSYQEIYF
ncbi:MAG: hypothetical protein IJ950_00970, partial [Helicobacter sp.]|nr:hypothetical protein [Helicobacter sp.]